MKTLKISKEIELPKDAVTQTFAMIGRKGSGKTYLATMIAEDMLDLNAQVIAIDPVGVWWGLRVGADGKSKGKEIFVIGGDHADIPLIPEAGARVAKLLVEKGISAVIDVSGFRIGEHKRFAADFAEEFFHLKKSNRSPVHMFIEEAQKIIPQRVGPDEARMVGAFEQIVRLGRNYGIGCSLVTQRPQSVNKEVLSQVECLCVLQVTGPHERKALEEWVQEVGADRTLVGELPSLERGEGYVWSPSWLRIYKKVHFSTKETFDASSTPEVGKKTQAASLSAVDVESLIADMADVVAKAEKDNPVVLRRKISELEQKNAKLERNPQKIVESEPKVIEKFIFKDNQITRLEKIFGNMTKEAERHGNAMALLWNNFNEIGKTLQSAFQLMLKSKTQVIASQKPVIKPFTPIQKPLVQSNIQEDGSVLRAGAMKMLNWLGTGEILSKQRLATLSGFAATGGTFNTYISELRRKGWVEGDENLRITEEGMKFAVSEALPSGEDLLNLWKSKFREGAGKILDFVYRQYPNPVSKVEIGANVGFEASGGTFNTYISELRRNGLIKVLDDSIIISEEFFN